MKQNRKNPKNKRSSRNQVLRLTNILPAAISVLALPALAANSPMPGQPAGNQPYPGLAQSRPEIRTRVLGGSAVGSGTRVALTDAGSIVRSSDGVAWFNVPRANVPLYGIACGGGLVLAVGHDRNILASTDGVQWNAQVSGTPSALHAIACDFSSITPVKTSS